MIIVILIVIFPSAVIGNVPSKLIGRPARLGDYPHQVSIRIAGFRHICSGSIIDHYHVLTTATCVICDAENVIFANIKISTISDVHNIHGNENVYDVSYVIYHPEYKIEELWKNDITILRLQKRLAFSVVEKPVKLPSQTINYERRALTMTGWKAAESTSLSSRPRFQKLSVIGLPRSTCSSYYRKLGSLVPGQSCFTSKTGTTLSHFDAGDSGNPITSNHRQHLIGIVSLIPLRLPWPVVFTKVIVYKNWILAMVESY